MIKIIDAIKAINENGDKISNVYYDGDRSYRFLYDSKYCIGIEYEFEDKDEHIKEGYYFRYYPNLQNPRDLFGDDMDDDCGIYSEYELEGNDTMQVIERLCNLLQSKEYDIDKVIDDILNTQ